MVHMGLRLRAFFSFNWKEKYLLHTLCFQSLFVGFLCELILRLYTSHKSPSSGGMSTRYMPTRC